MASRDRSGFVIVGAGAAGLMAARELARAGKRVVVLEARERCGGRIDPLPTEEFGYPAEGGAEFVHGAAALTRRLMREAGLSLLPAGGRRWRAANGVLAPDERATPYAAEFHRALAALSTDLPVADFLARNFAGPHHAELRSSILRMVEGFDAADPSRASTFALREEWMGSGPEQPGRITEGYGALVAFLLDECGRHGAVIHLGKVVTAIDTDGDGIVARCRDGSTVAASAAILTVPLPLLANIALPPAAAAKLTACGDIGFGNVIKLVLRFATSWWEERAERDLSFLISSAAVPTWWTEHPARHPVLTGWLAGPRAAAVTRRAGEELVGLGLHSLAEMFALPPERLRQMLVASRAINWGDDPWARGAYSYATPRTRDAQSTLLQPAAGIFFSGEARYAGAEMGTVEAALASGSETAQTILAT